MSNMGVDSTHTNIFGSCCGPWGIGQGASGTKYQAMPPSYRGYLVMRQQMLRRPQLSSHCFLHLMQLLQRRPQLRHCHPDLQSQTSLTCCSCSTSTHSVFARTMFESTTLHRTTLVPSHVTPHDTMPKHGSCTSLSGAASVSSNVKQCMKSKSVSQSDPT